MRVIIALGKTGDILSALPVARHYHAVDGVKPVMMVARQYSQLLDRIPFAETRVYDGDWQDLEGAFREAKAEFSDVLVMSTYGRNFPIEHRHSSFQLDSYDRAGVLKLWDTLSLEIPRGKPKQFPKPTILFADHSQSSPFLQKDDLYALLKAEFPKHDILRFSEHRVADFLEFLEWYDGAKALVTIETAHLHLSAATKTPVIALATDKPSRWNGSCWSKRFAFFCRYGEFDDRKEHLVESLRDAMSGRKKLDVVELN